MSKDAIFHENIFHFHDEASSYEQFGTTTTSQRFLSEENLSCDQPYIIMAPPQHLTSTPASHPTVDEISTSMSTLEHSIEHPIMPTEENSNFSSIGSPSVPTTANESSLVLQDNPPCHSGRLTRPPTWTKDYICAASNSSGTHYRIYSYISFHQLLS